ncbi:MAG TPA: ABC transporter permease [Actinomycetales bacterium]|jgi:ABC-2 type transport system permease protein
MSTSELARTDRPGAPALQPLRLLASELRLVFGRRRNQALLAVLSLAPILIGTAVRLADDGGGAGGEGPAFIGQITQNGLFLSFTALTVTLPFFLPLAVAVVSGESIAGEASSGTLRNLLVVPVSRTRLLVVKYVSVVFFALACALVVWGVGLLVGLLLFPQGEVTLLSGTTVSFGEALLRALLVALYVGAMLAGVAAIGVFFSTLTEVPMGAMAATAVLTIASQIIGAVPQVSGIWPYLFTTPWFAFGDLLRSPVPLGDMGLGLLTQGVYIVLFLLLAWARLTTKDISS